MKIYSVKNVSGRTLNLKSAIILNGEIKAFTEKEYPYRKMDIEYLKKKGMVEVVVREGEEVNGTVFTKGATTTEAAASEAPEKEITMEEALAQAHEAARAAGATEEDIAKLDALAKMKEEAPVAAEAVEEAAAEAAEAEAAEAQATEAAETADTTEKKSKKKNK